MAEFVDDRNRAMAIGMSSPEDQFRDLMRRAGLDPFGGSPAGFQLGGAQTPAVAAQSAPIPSLNLPMGASSAPGLAKAAAPSAIDQLLKILKPGTDWTSLALGGAQMLASLFGGEADPYDDIVKSNDPRARFINPKDALFNQKRSAAGLMGGISSKLSQPINVQGAGGYGDISRPGMDTGVNDFIANLINPAGEGNRLPSRTSTPVGMRNPQGVVQGTGMNPTPINDESPRATARLRKK